MSGRDLAAGDARHDGVGAVALDVGEVGVVGVLERAGVGVEHVAVPLAGQDRGDRRLADVAAAAAAVRLDDVVEAAVAVHGHEVEQLLPGEREVLAQPLVDDPALAGVEVLDQRLDHRLAGAARRARAGASRPRRPLRCTSRLADVVARADDRLVGHAGDARSRPPRAMGRISSSGLSGRAMPEATIGRSTPYADASPTRIPPSRRVPVSSTTSFL